MLHISNEFLTILTSGRFLQFLTVALAAVFLWSGAHADFDMTEIIHISNEF